MQAKGVIVTINEQPLNVKGSLLLFLADTLAAHQLGGFKVGVGFALRKCRNCLCTSEDMNIQVSKISVSYICFDVYFPSSLTIMTFYHVLQIFIAIIVHY